MKIHNSKNSVTSAGVLVPLLALLLALVLAVAALAITGCGDDADQPGGGNASAGMLTLTEADNGKSFAVKVGDTITVVLAGNPTTGYEWAADLTEDSAALLVATGDPVYKPDVTDETLVGSGGQYEFTFTAAAAGQAELKLKYWRSFEPDVVPNQTFATNLTIE